MSRTRSMPTWAMSSRRPRNGLMQTAPAFAERSAWVAEKQSVWLTRIPLPERYFTALRPSFVSGHFTTAFGATWASSWPSFTMPSKSVATTSRLTSPGTIAQISSTSGRNGRFSLAISDGLVVTPSTTPSATPSLISPRFAVSRKIFIAPSSGVGSLPLDRHARSRAHLLEDPGIAHDLAHDVHGARRAALVAVAHRRRAEENAEGAARGPVAEVARVDDLAGRLGGRREADAEVDLVAPRLALGLERKRIPDRARRLRVVEPRVRGDRSRRDPDRTIHRTQPRPWFRHVSSNAPGWPQVRATGAAGGGRPRGPLHPPPPPRPDPPPLAVPPCDPSRPAPRRGAPPPRRPARPPPPRPARP